MIHSLASRLLGVPGSARRLRSDTEWVALSDGVRLATHVVQPADLGGPRAPAVMLRTPFGTGARLEPAVLLAEALAGLGLVAVLQDVRGRFDSEGRFVPFTSDARDGAECVSWIEDQPWYDGRLGLVGFSYAAWAALAAAARVPGRVTALALVGGGGRPETALRPGGAFALELGLSFALGLCGRETPGSVDVVRALRHRPLREADRVALRETAWFRQWVDHPRGDPYWKTLEAGQPETLPALLVVGGAYDPWLEAAVADHAALAGAGSRARLVLGPWPHPRPPRFSREGRAAQRDVLDEVVRFLGAELLGEGPALSGVRVQGPGGPLELPQWPPAATRALRLHLRGGGAAGGSAGDGRLDEQEPTIGEAPDRFVYDPEDPAPSGGGALLSTPGALDQRAVETRSDVLCYTGAPLSRRLRVCGPARVVLHAASSAPDTDFTAKLVDVDTRGRAALVREGIVRCRHRAGGPQPRWLEPGVPVELEIELGPTCHGFEPGHRLRLEISSSSFPRFDRNPNTRSDPARATAETSGRASQTVLHEPAHPSRVELPILET